MMERNLSFAALRNSFLFLILANFSLEVQAQQWRKADSLTFRHEVTSVSQDVTGNIYIADNAGILRKYSNTLELLASNEGSTDQISNINAAQVLKIFAFYQNTQEFQLFNRLLNPIQPPQSFQTEIFARYSAATISSDQMIWLVNDDRLRLQKYNPILQEVIIDTDLSYYIEGDVEIKSLLEHNNRLYMQQHQEILIFDFMGNFLSKLPLEVYGSFSLHHDGLFFLQGEKLAKYHLGKMEMREVGIKFRDDLTHILSSNDSHYLFSGKKLIVFRKIL